MLKHITPIRLKFYATAIVNKYLYTILKLMRSLDALFYDKIIENLIENILRTVIIQL